MTYLYLGMLLFAGPHLFSMLMPAHRDVLRERYGEKAWKGVYALLTLAGLVLMVVGFLGSRSGPRAADLLYFPGDWTPRLTMPMVLLGFILLGASHGKGYLKLWVQNPMSLGIGLWSLGHLLANGKRADVYLFGTFFGLAALDIVLSMARGKKPTHEPRLKSDVIAVVVGVILYLVFLFGFHPYVLNLPVAE